LCFDECEHVCVLGDLVFDKVLYLSDLGVVGIRQQRLVLLILLLRLSGRRFALASVLVQSVDVVGTCVK